MKIRLPFLMFTFFLSIFIFLPTYSSSQDIGEPLPPPVTINFFIENISPTNNEVTLKISVTLLEDIHAEIRCIFPKGIMPVQDSEYILNPYINKYPFNGQEASQDQSLYREALDLWVGPLLAGEMKEFVFNVIIQDKGSYEFVAIVEALAKWGVKKEVLLVDIN